MFGHATNGYLRWSGALIHKSAIAIVLLVIAGAGAAFFSTRVPSSAMTTPRDARWRHLSMNAS